MMYDLASFGLDWNYRLFSGPTGAQLVFIPVVLIDTPGISKIQCVGTAGDLWDVKQHHWITGAKKTTS